MNKFNSVLFYVAAATFLVGCGGTTYEPNPPPGPPPPPVASTDSFPLSQALTNLGANGMFVGFEIQQWQGSPLTMICDGAGSRKISPATTSVIIPSISGSPILMASEDLAWSWGRLMCYPRDNDIKTTWYYDNDYHEIGFERPGTFVVYKTTPIFPALVQVGDTGIVGTQYIYSDNTEAYSQGYIDTTYQVTADTASSALVTFVGMVYDMSGNYSYMQVYQWRIKTDASLAPVATQFSFPGDTSIIWKF